MSTTYFKNFPIIDYEVERTPISSSSNDQFDPTTSIKLSVRDIMLKHIIVEEIISDKAAFYDYHWKDEDRPDTVAEKYYGSQDWYWVVLLSNGVHDPYHDFPVPHHSFNNYLVRKYAFKRKEAEEWYFANVVNNSNTLRIINETDPSKTIGREYLRDADPVILFLQSSIHHYEDDEGNHTDSFEGGNAISYYSFEQQENEDRRKVKLLDRRYLGQFVTEAENKIKQVAKQYNTRR